VYAARHLLNDDGHLFLAGWDAQAFSIDAGAFQIHGGIDQLDRLDHLSQPDLGVGVAVGDQIGAKDSREGIGNAILQHRGRPHSQREIRLAEHALEGGDDIVGERTAQKHGVDLFIAHVLHRLMIHQTGIVGHKAIKNSCGQHGRDGHADLHFRILLADVAVAVQHHVQKGQSASLAADGVITDLIDQIDGKIALSGVILDLFPAPVGDQGLEGLHQLFTQDHHLIDGFEASDVIRQGELRVSAQPVHYVLVAVVIKQTFIRYYFKLMRETYQGLGLCHNLLVWSTKDESAKADLVPQPAA